jgi:hypothetical protein
MAVMIVMEVMIATEIMHLLPKMKMIERILRRT